MKTVELTSEEVSMVMDIEEFIGANWAEFQDHQELNGLDEISEDQFSGLMGKLKG
jgi:hypothetical protein